MYDIRYAIPKGVLGTTALEKLLILTQEHRIFNLGLEQC